MLTLRIAFRSFIRHRRRSAITAAAIALGLAMLLMFVGIAEDAHARMAELGIRMGSGHVLVEAQGYRETQTLDYVVKDADRIAREIATVPAVQRIAIRLRTSGLITAGTHSAPVLVSGVDPKRESAASDIASPNARIAGAYLRTRAQMPYANAPADIYVGKTLAERLDIKQDDRVVLTLAPASGAKPVSAAFLLRGVFATGVDELDGSYVEIPLQEARTLLGLPHAATEVAALTDLESTSAVAAAIKQRLASEQRLNVVPWQVALQELYDAIVLDDLGLYAMMAIVFMVVALGIFNTMLMSVTERTRELGVMMALGTSKLRLFGQILAEAVVLAMFSLAIGVGLGLALHSWIAHSGIDVGGTVGELEFAGIAWSGMIYSKLTSAAVIRWTLVVGGVVLLSALYPALRVTRLAPVEAMRHV